MDTLSRGIWASVMATTSMTMSLFKLFQQLPLQQRSPLPPAVLAKEIGHKLSLSKNLNLDEQSQFTMFSHYGYGAMAGVLYTLLTKKIPGNPILKGSVFGLGVWAVSYFVIIPALGLKSSGAKMSRERNLMMLTAHLIWGASLGYSEHALREKGKNMLAGGKNSLLAH